MRAMWMMIFMILPFLAIAYVGWQVWSLVPLPRLFRAILIITGILSFLLIFLNFNRTIDRMPLWLARLSYAISNSSLFILLYLVITFLVLDLGRLVRLIPKGWVCSTVCGIPSRKHTLSTQETRGTAAHYREGVEKATASGDVKRFALRLPQYKSRTASLG